MAKTDLLYCLLRQHNWKLAPYEKTLLKINLITRIVRELDEIFKSQYRPYQQLFKSFTTYEENMQRTRVMQEVIKDILSTEEYSLAGISIHTHIPEEVLYDVVAGMNADPTLETSMKIFELHISVRRSLYDEIMKKIASEYMASA